MAIEDIIWGKNRHMFGGIEPDEVEIFKDIWWNNQTLGFTIEVPEDTVFEDQVLCTVAGVMVRGSLTGYPEDECSGFLIGNYTESGCHESSIESLSSVPEDAILYLSAFSYSDQGVFNRNAKRRAVRNIVDNYLFGYDLDVNDEEPTTRVTYPKDVDNGGYEKPVTRAGSIEMNDWSNLSYGSYFVPRPCMLKYDGTVDYYLNSGHYRYKQGGTVESDIDNAAYEGNAMMEWPKIYTKRWEEDGIYHFRCSNVKQDSDYECWCNYDENREETDYFYVGIYPGVDDTEHNRLRSMCYGASNTLNMDTRGREILARSNGNGWGSMHVEDVFLIQDLLVLISRTTNLNSVFGGKAHYYSGSINLDGLGGRYYDLFEYKEDSPTMLFGMYEYFGVGNGMQVNGAAFTGNGCLQIAINHPDFTYEKFSIPDKTGYIIEMRTMPYGRIPYKVGGSSTQYECSQIENPHAGSDVEYTQKLLVNHSGFYFGYSVDIAYVGYGGHFYNVRLSYRLKKQSSTDEI